MAWQAEDGSIHATEEGAREHNRNQNAMIAFALWVFLVLPVLITKFVAWVFGLFFGLGIIGKALQTVFVAIVCPMIAIIVLSFTGLIEKLPEFITVFLLFGSFIMSALWYWLWHYDTIKRMSASEFSEVIKISFCICFYGFLGAGIIGLMTSEAVMSVLMLLIFAGAAIFYFSKVKPYEEEAAAERQPDPRRKKILIIGLNVVVALSILSAVSTAIDRAVTDSKFRKEHSAIFDAAKNASKQRVTAYVTYTYSGDRGTPMTMSNGTSTWLQVGDTLIITGEAQKKSKRSPWYVVPVDHGGDSGFIEVNYIGLTRPVVTAPATGTATPAAEVQVNAAEPVVEIEELEEEFVD